MRKLLLYFFGLTVILSVACSDTKKEREEEISSDKIENIPQLGAEFAEHHVIMSGYDSSEFAKHYGKRTEPPAIDLNQSLEGKSMAELIILKNTVLAMKGNHFEDAVLLDYFDQMPWYQPPFWDPDFSITLSEEEEIFSKRTEQKILELQKQNYAGENAAMPNPGNIVNAFQYHNLPAEARGKLSSNGFIIENAAHDQLFDVYEQNQKNHIPSFITTDLVMQQMHLFYGELENEIEEQYLIDILSSMLEIINKDLYVLYEKTLDSLVETSIEENLMYYSIPYAVITNKKNNLLGDYKEIYFSELGKVLAGKGKGSKVMRDNQFDYKIFNPVNHYTKNEQTQHYFKALNWLQKVTLCLNNEKDFSNAILAAFVINRNRELRVQYDKFIEYKSYFSSQKDQFTLWNLADVLSEIDGIETLEELYDENTIKQIKTKLNIESGKQCQISVSLMPIEYQNLFTDLGEIDKASSAPNPINLFAALDNPAAIQQQSSAGTDKKINDSVKENLIAVSVQENAVSMDWLSTLLTSYNENSGGTGYMTKTPWKNRELNSALASWILLDERVFLEAEGITPVLATEEPGLPTVLRGYVEPNIAFWRAASVLLNNTKVFFKDRNILSGKMEENLDRLLDLSAFLEEVSRKEIQGIELDTQTYERIASIGTECHDFALGLINPNFSTKYQRISSDLAFATPVYQGSETNNLIGATGLGNTVLALVELEGFIYLTRGAVYSYYEISNYPKPEISQQQWNDLLSGNNPPQPTAWFRDFIVNQNTDKKLASNK